MQNMYLFEKLNIRLVTIIVERVHSILVVVIVKIHFVRPL